MARSRWRYMYWMRLLWFFDLLCYVFQLSGDPVLVAGILLQNLVHLIAALSLLRRFYCLCIAVFQGLDAFVVRVESGDHASNRFDLFDEFLINLVLGAVLFLVDFFVIEVVLGGGAAHQRCGLSKRDLTDLSSWRRSIMCRTNNTDNLSSAIL